MHLTHNYHRGTSEHCISVGLLLTELSLLAIIVPGARRPGSSPRQHVALSKRCI